MGELQVGRPKFSWLEDGESAVRTARTFVQVIAGLISAALVLLPEVAALAQAHADLPLAGVVGAYAVQALAAITAATWWFNKLELWWPSFRGLLPVWLRREVVYVTDGKLGDGE